MICGQELLKVFEVTKTLGTNQKIALFSQLKSNPIVCNILVYGTDIYRQYHIRDLPQVNSPFDHCQWETLFKALDTLTQSKGASNKDREILSVIASPCEFCRKIVLDVLRHELRIGMGIKNLREAGYNIESSEHVQLCKEDILKFQSKDCFLASDKLNGFRVKFHQGNNGIEFLSRKGKPYLMFNQLFRKYMIPSGVIFDGEIIHKLGRKEDFDFLASVAKSEKSTYDDPRQCDVKVAVFDCPSLGEESLFYRLKFLKEEIKLPQDVMYVLPHIEVKPTSESNFVEEVLRLLEEAIPKRYEGIIIKNPFVEYELKRSHSWVKVKEMKYSDFPLAFDLPVVGKIEGKRGSKNEGRLGSLVVDFQGVQVRVGYGYSDQQRIEFWSKPPKIIEVRAQQITKDGSLLFPGFMRPRDDEKDTGDFQNV
jgi:hypothetical protein